MATFCWPTECQVNRCTAHPLVGSRLSMSRRQSNQLTRAFSRLKQVRLFPALLELCYLDPDAYGSSTSKTSSSILPERRQEISAWLSPTDLRKLAESPDIEESDSSPIWACSSCRAPRWDSPDLLAQLYTCRLILETHWRVSGATASAWIQS